MGSKREFGNNSLKSPKIGKLNINTLIIPQGLWIHEKNQSSKISCYCPFKKYQGIDQSECRVSWLSQANHIRCTFSYLFGLGSVGGGMKEEETQASHAAHAQRSWDGEGVGGRANFLHRFPALCPLWPKSEVVYLKGQSHEIFGTWFFPPNNSSWSH